LKHFQRKQSQYRTNKQKKIQKQNKKYYKTGVYN